MPPPAGDTTPKIEDTAATSKPVATAPKPADEVLTKSDTATTSMPAPPAPESAGDTVAKIERAATTSKPVPPAPKPAAGTKSMEEDSAAISRPTPPDLKPKADAPAARKKPSWKNVRSATAVADQNIFYDEDNLGYQTLQKANQALKGFPLVKKQGELDWGEALNSGLIQPRASLSGEGEMMVLDLDIVMKDTQSKPYVRFSHKIHTQWLECSNCHQQIFIPMTGANPISKTAILDGKYCGVCHNKVALTTHNCERCHNVPAK
jgi:c(7)-type cytochrome triheme protein